MRLGAALLTLSLLGVVAPVRADPTAAEIAAARELFDEGIALETKGRWAQALDRFRKVAAVKTTPQVRFHVALCLENTGKLVDALVEFQRAQVDAEKDPAAGMVASHAAKHVAELKERIPRVIVIVPSDIAGVTLTIDGASVTTSLIGTAIPLDPGKHSITVTAPQRAAFEQQIELVERGKPVTVQAVLPPADAPAKVVPVTPKEPEQPPHRGFGPWPWLVGGAGVAALAGGTVLYVLRQRTIDELSAACAPDRTQCPEDQRDVADRGRTYTTWGNVLFGVGAVGIVSSAVLFALAPSDAPGSARTSLHVATGPGLFGIGLGGTF